MSERVIDNLRKIVGKGLLPLTGTVTAVDVDAGTCDVTPSDGGADVLSVRLRAVLDDRQDGLMLVPATGADVLLLPLDADTYAVVLASELVEVRVKIGATDVVVSNGLVKFNDGRHGGLVLSEVVAKQHNAVLSLIEKLQYITPAGVTAPLLLAGAPIVPGATLLPYQVRKGDFENPNVTHG